MVAQGHNGHDAVRLCEQFEPDILLLDIVMPGMNGIDATREIHQRFPHIRILVLSSFQDDDSVRQMLSSGAAGYVVKGSLAADLAETVRLVHGGKAVFSAEITQTLLSVSIPETPAHSDFGLTGREREILRLVAEGKNNGEVAAQLVISQSTVKFHLVNILAKMQVETRAEAIVLAARHNLL